MSVFVPISQERSHEEPEKIGFAAALGGHEGQFPLLEAAVANQEPAVRESIEWPVGDNLWRNYAQMLRSTFGVTDTELSTTMYGGGKVGQLQATKLTEFLAGAEKILRSGVPSRSMRLCVDPEDGEQYEVWTQACGGIQAFLGRGELVPGDRLALRPLRDLTLRSNVQHGDADEMTWEYLAEFSLEVHPA